MNQKMISHSKNKILIDLNPRHSPVIWVNSIFVNLDNRLASLVATHLVAAVLHKSHPGHAIDVRPTKEGYAESRYSRIVTIGALIYHITTKPDGAVIRACKHSLSTELKTILLVPKTKIKRMLSLVKERKLDNRLNIFSLEEFISTIIILIAGDKGIKPIKVFKGILREYKQRIKATESDPRLGIELL